MTKFQFTLQEMTQGQSFAAGQSHVITVLTVRRVRLVGIFFDLNKCFLLPSAMGGIRSIKTQYDQHPSSNLLVVWNAFCHQDRPAEKPWGIREVQSMLTACRKMAIRF